MFLLKNGGGGGRVVYIISHDVIDRADSNFHTIRIRANRHLIDFNYSQTDAQNMSHSFLSLQ